MPVEIMVAVNNRHGNKTGYVDSLEVVLEGDVLFGATAAYWPPGFRLDGEENRFSVGSLAYSKEVLIPYLRHSAYVGSIIWDAFNVKTIDAVNLLNWIIDHQYDRWVLGESAPSFRAKWEDKKQVVQADFDNPWEPVKSGKEWREMLRQWTKGVPTPAGERC